MEEEGLLIHPWHAAQALAKLRLRNEEEIKLYYRQQIIIIYLNSWEGNTAKFSKIELGGACRSGDQT